MCVQKRAKAEWNGNKGEFAADYFFIAFGLDAAVQHQFLHVNHTSPREGKYFLNLVKLLIPLSKFSETVTQACAWLEAEVTSQC